MKITTLFASAAIAVALSGATVLSAAPAQAATPLPAATSSTRALAAPDMAGFLVSLGSWETPDVIGSGVEPYATVEVSYAGQTTTVTAGEEGFWSTKLPGGDFVKDVDTVTAVQIVDGERSAAASYTVPDRYLPHF
ncbi:hypothetical protein [Frondihabitans peucedani]|uniref:Uncharacterized protein n=1 Tax=Frondihabitans peucedani TaxID=598626 RepID=A0ABP8E4N0_9MICO